MKKTKKYYEPVKLVIPDSINYDELWKRIEDLKPLEKKQVKNSVYLFLSFLFPSEIYLSKYQKNGFYKNINSTAFNKLTRNRLTKVIDILSDIIDEDSSYLSGSYSKSYKIKEKYFFTATPKFVTIQSTISQNYFDFKRKKELEIKELNKKYDYLISQYDKSISLHPTVNDYIDKLEMSLNQRLNDYSVNNPKLHSLEGIIQMKIRLMRECVKKINNGEFNPSMSVSNHRLNSVLTLMKRELRNFILVDGLPVCEVDIRNSHSYVLGSLMNNEFFSSTSISGYNMVSIYKELYELLTSSTGIDNKYYNIILNNDSLNNYLFSSSNINNNKGDISLWSIMCGTFSNVKDIKIYNQLPFHTGIYDYINQIFYKGEKSIESIKKGIMNFHNLQKYRKTSPVVKEMGNAFPSVNNIIEQINNLSKNKGYMSILLQRAESYLLLKIGAQELLKRIPNLKFFTVHDSLVVPEDQAESVSKILSDSISEFTGIEIGLKIKRTKPFENIEETVDEIWNKSLKNLNLNKS